MYICEYFNITELVSPVVYNRFGSFAWNFFSSDVLEDLDIIRVTWRKPIIINNWKSGGNLKQCGLRSNLDEIVKNKTLNEQLYVSFHALGKAFDLHDARGQNQELWEHCYELLKKGKLKTFKRLENYEKTNGWVHIDAANCDKITIF